MKTNWHRINENITSGQGAVGIMFIGSFIAMGFGIYGLSESLMASICLPLSASGLIIWCKL